MSNWLLTFENYRSDQTLLATLNTQLRVLLDDYGYSRENAQVVPVIRTITELEDSLAEAERSLNEYVKSASTPREAAKRLDEKLFLTYRYMHGMTMEETAEEMSVSRDTVYRIKRRLAAMR
jgi:DNA-directed RNA polymerase specialized sigma subunit